MAAAWRSFLNLGTRAFGIFLGVQEDVLARARTSAGEAGDPLDDLLTNTLPHTSEDPMSASERTARVISPKASATWACSRHIGGEGRENAGISIVQTNP